MSLILIPTSFDPNSARNIEPIYPWIAAFVILRPGSANLLAVFALTFAYAILIGTPFGLWSALLLISSEVLRAIRPWLIWQNFLVEWATVIGVFICALVLQFLLLLVFFLPTIPFSANLESTLYTAALYIIFSSILRLTIRTRRGERKARTESTIE